MFGDSGAVIGMKVKEKKYKEIVRKLLMKRDLTDEEIKFLEKEGLK